ncbi:hypothetical protein POVWA2_009350 [Plasmodium ovale wallikeri]|uniref:Uncharacterized protein n=1 Tax=Plasmodium ovale wallikeri TaxID=864142 RepID=A0A1A8YK24_PLAOA|nr:hypothetical protein POVWA1_009340 [Plasmodium ovale wallikeri]SBT32411.1 hypothetical protein POVWA2_009350 [Plasmodium ovale wallikeri]
MIIGLRIHSFFRVVIAFVVTWEWVCIPLAKVGDMGGGGGPFTPVYIGQFQRCDGVRLQPGFAIATSRSAHALFRYPVVLHGMA